MGFIKKPSAPSLKALLTAAEVVSLLTITTWSRRREGSALRRTSVSRPVGSATSTSRITISGRASFAADNARPPESTVVTS
ncbi:hypothetical protein D3C72_1056920 [compost metagenome]